MSTSETDSGLDAGREREVSTTGDEAAAPERAEATKAPRQGGKRRPRSIHPGREGLTRTLRIVSALGVLALGAGVVVGASALPTAQVAQAQPLAVAVPPTGVALTCPTAPAATSGAATDSELSGASTTTTQVLGAVLARGGALPSATLGTLTAAGTALTSGPDGAIGTLADPAEPSVLRADPAGGAAAFAVAATASRADSGDLRGLSAASCPAGSSTLWFAGGRTTIGSSATLSLRNAGSTAATVTLAAWGATGPVALTSTAVVVPPGSQQTVSLEAVAPDQDRLALQLTAAGGLVSATIATNQLDGLTPAGTDVVSATAAPGVEALVPGVVLGSSTIDDEDTALVRVLNPGETPATVSIELLGSDGVVPISGLNGLVVEAGAVTDVTLGGAPPGTYTVRVSSDLPVVTGASLVRVGQPAPEDPDVPVIDRAWLPSVASGTSQAVALPGLGSVVERAQLVIGAVEDATVTATALDATGTMVGTVEVDVPAGRSVALDASQLGSSPALVRLTSDAPVAAGAVLTYTDPLGELVSVIGAQQDPQVERSAAIRVSLG